MKFLIQYKKYNDIIFSENPIEFLSPSKWHGSKNEWLHFSKFSKKLFPAKNLFHSLWSISSDSKARKSLARGPIPIIWHQYLIRVS